MANPAGTIDEYIASFPPETRKVLEDLRALIKKAAPEATEKISYAMPTFDVNGQYLIYFAGWKKHIALYPITAGVATTFAKELEGYKSAKASMHFPLGEPMPVDLIRRIVEFRVGEVMAGGGSAR